MSASPTGGPQASRTDQQQPSRQEKGKGQFQRAKEVTELKGMIDSDKDIKRCLEFNFNYNPDFTRYDDPAIILTQLERTNSEKQKQKSQGSGHCAWKSINESVAVLRWYVSYQVRSRTPGSTANSMPLIGQAALAGPPIPL